MSRNKAVHQQAIDRADAARVRARRVCGRLAVAGMLLGLAAVAQAQSEVSFQIAPRDFSSDKQGSWSLGYDRMLDPQVSVGLSVGVAEIEAPVGRSQGVSAALRATHYLVRPSLAVPLQPYIGAQLGGAWQTDRSATTIGLFLGERLELSPTTDLRTDLYVAHKTTTEEHLLGANGTSSGRNIIALRIGMGFRY